MEKWINVTKSNMMVGSTTVAKCVQHFSQRMCAAAPSPAFRVPFSVPIFPLVASSSNTATTKGSIRHVHTSPLVAMPQQGSKIHSKTRNDAKRERVVTKASRSIANAIALAGGEKDPKLNGTLASAISKAKAENVPRSTIEKAIAGYAKVGPVSEIVYEGVSSGGVSLVIRCMTSNQGKCIIDVRNAVTKLDWFKIVASGTVMYKFPRRGVVSVTESALDGRDPMDVALEIGAEDIDEDSIGESSSEQTSDGNDRIVRFLCAVSDLQTCVNELQSTFDIVPHSFEIAHVPTSKIEISSKDDAERLEHVVSVLESVDDVEQVFHDAA